MKILKLDKIVLLDQMLLLDLDVKLGMDVGCKIVLLLVKLFWEMEFLLIILLYHGNVK